MNDEILKKLETVANEIIEDFNDNKHTELIANITNELLMSKALKKSDMLMIISNVILNISLTTYSCASELPNLNDAEEWAKRDSTLINIMTKTLIKNEYNKIREKRENNEGVGKV